MHDPMHPVLPPVPLPVDESLPLPDDELCLQWWGRFEMLENVRRHSLRVAQVASCLADMALPGGKHGYLYRAVRASALLHDLAKSYTIRHGGHHNQLGGAWTMELTNNPLVAQGVVHHIFWPGDLDLDAFFLPLVIIYSDKRVRHDEVVSLEDRQSDLMTRYGTKEIFRARIRESFVQVRRIEQELEKRTGVNLCAYSFDCRGLV